MTNPPTQGVPHSRSTHYGLDGQHQKSRGEKYVTGLWQPCSRRPSGINNIKSTDVICSIIDRYETGSESTLIQSRFNLVSEHFWDTDGIFDRMKIFSLVFYTMIVYFSPLSHHFLPFDEISSRVSREVSRRRRFKRKGSINSTKRRT